MKIPLHRRACLFLGVALFSALSFTSLSSASSPEDCLMCHSEKTFSTQRKGVDFSLYINGTEFSQSIHSEITCIGCHTDAVLENYSHPSPLNPVNCANCHEEKQKRFDLSIHGKVLKKGAPYAPSCISCHGKHNILKRDNPNSPSFKLNIPLLCGRCHREDAPVSRYYDISQKNIIEHYSQSIHGEGLLKKGLLATATCNNCHRSHMILPHTDPESSTNTSNIGKTCSTCHTMIEQVHKKVIRGELWREKPGLMPACTDCHSPHEIRKKEVAEGMSDDGCLKCHKDSKPIVSEDDLDHSVHDKIPCVRCHSDVTPKHERPCDTAGRVDCSNCHAQQFEAFSESTHGQLYSKKDPAAPYCTDCHGDHKILSKNEADSPTSRMKIPVLCAQCHGEGKKQKDVVTPYLAGTHGKGLMEKGLISAAVCTDCHTTHNELPASNPQSSINPANLTLTCAECHRGIYQKFSLSIHSPIITKTDKRLPSCSDCHMSHDIQRTDQDSFMQQIGHQCGNCHEDVAKTYFETYHGKAYLLGHSEAAKCSDCHGSHDILKPSDPNSHLSRNNVVNTCKKCHPGSNRKFTGYLTHATHHNRIKYPILFFTFWGMALLLVGTFAFFGVHTMLWLPKSLKRLKEKRETHVSEEPKQFVRFKLRERLLHLSVIISFLGLAITGMVLKFAQMPWAEFISNLIGGIKVAGIIHRICAVITFGYFTTHLYTLYKYKKDNKLTFWQLIFHKNSLVPNLRDAVEFWQTTKWFFGRGPRPQYGRWTYWEKFDYFAVFWGVAIIGCTGLVLWFPELFTKFLPGWIINVATIIHSDEALLAVGFIFTIHFFNTHLRPEAFPMDPAIFTGRVSISELKHDRPREYEEVIESGELEQNLVKPISKWKLRLAYIFGLTCLTAGVSLIVLIIYSMLFGYK